MKNHCIFLSKEDIVKRLNIDTSVIRIWEEAGLLSASKKNGNNNPCYNKNDFIQAEKIKSLLNLGYDIDAIKKIMINVGLPAGTNPKGTDHEKLLTIGELAEKSQISARTLKYWEEKELINPDTRSSGGFRLYRESFIEICLRIKELQLFGYTVEEIKNMSLSLLPDERLEEELSNYDEEKIKDAIIKFQTQVNMLTEKITDIKKALRRWEKIIKNQTELSSHLKINK